MARIAVVGAGMGALAAAARLAAAGHRVTVCERSHTHGGAVGRFSLDGFSFDTGPALLHLPAVYRDLFIKTARTAGQPRPRGAGKGTLEESVALRAVDPAVRHILPDGTVFTLPNVSRGGTVRALDAALGAGAGRRWGLLLDRARQVWEAVRRPLLEEPLGGPAEQAVLEHDLYPPVRRWLWPRRGPESLADIAGRELRRPGLAALLEEYALRYGHDPARAPASLVALVYMETTFGTWYVTGGMRALADAVFDRCTERGVEFRFGAEAVALPRKDGRVAGVDLADGTRIEADAVVFGADVRLLPRLLGEEAGYGHTEPVGPPGRFTVLLALRGGRPADAAHRTVVHTPDRSAESAAVFAGGAPYERPTVEVLRPDDPTLRPDDGHEAVTLRAVVAAHGPAGRKGAVDWTASGLADRFAQRMIDAAGAALPGLRERMLWYRVRTPADTERETGAPGGGVPGPALAGGEGRFLAPDNRTPIPGLYLVGGSAHPGGGLPHSGMSGAITAALIGPAESSA